MVCVPFLSNDEDVESLPWAELMPHEAKIESKTDLELSDTEEISRKKQELEHWSVSWMYVSWCVLAS